MNEYGIVTIVQCRLGSRRLKGKALKVIAGRPMLSHVLERAQAITYGDKPVPVVLATSVSTPDDAVAKIGDKMDGVGVYRGDESDVLGRLSAAATQCGARIIVRVTGDCPLLAPDVAEKVIILYNQGGRVIATNDTNISGWPDGMDVEVFLAADLHEAAMLSTRKEDREHVTTWIKRQLSTSVLPGPASQSFGGVAPTTSFRRSYSGRVSGPKLSVDVTEDYEFIKAVYSHLEPGELGWEATFTAVRTVLGHQENKKTAPKKTRKPRARKTA